jgi:hypothetical protein
MQVKLNDQLQYLTLVISLGNLRAPCGESV